ncbi:hypothetical protein C9374_006739 [Naegleria lovaniensis]|uniref:Uncharacterized protein n=1 Tax=Naegleria lovaniensis TaxID=51637 RepID=A0AA88GLI7_NAELO|nr:uncharacterized protein C9374_006739 [Naegleria lovaniensis]KAG2379622.1 hypothetical protein C9374_006739 [Naegleria lovaniensis]
MTFGGHYTPYFDPSFDAHKEYRKEFILKKYRSTSNKLQSSSYSKLFDDRSLRGVSAWLKEQATETERKEFHALFKRLGDHYQHLETQNNPFKAESEVDRYFYVASSYGHGVLSEKAIKCVASYFKNHSQTCQADMNVFKNVMSALTSFRKHIQPMSHEQSVFLESTPHLLDQKKSKPVYEVAAEKWQNNKTSSQQGERPKSAPAIQNLSFQRRNVKNSTFNNNSPLTSRPSTSHLAKMHDRNFNTKKPYAYLPTQGTNLPTSKTYFARPNSKTLSQYVKTEPAWKATTCATASGGVVEPAFTSVLDENSFQPSSARSKCSSLEQEKKIKDSKQPITKQAQNKESKIAIGKTTYGSTYQPQVNIKSKPFHQTTHHSKPYGDYGTVDFLTEYCKRFASKR